MQKSIAILSALLLSGVLALSGCAQPEAPPDLARVYVKGVLDTLYLGEYSEDFISLTDTRDPGELEREYLAGLDAEADYFSEYFGVGELTENARKQVKDLYRDLYKLARYEVSPSLLENEIYSVDVAIQPLDAIDRVAREDLETYAAGLKTSLSPDLSQEQRTDAYVEGLIGLIREKMEEPGYFEPVTITLEVSKSSEDGLYRIEGKGLAEVDEQLIRY